MLTKGHFIDKASSDENRQQNRRVISVKSLRLVFLRNVYFQSCAERFCLRFDSDIAAISLQGKVRGTELKC